MLKKFVNKYASLLDGRDVSKLFNHLRNKANRSEAARICKLERRTTYYWENNREVRLTTRKKVLRAILKKDFEFTIKYLLNRVNLSLYDVLSLYLGSIYEKAMNPRITSDQFEKLLKNFLEVRIQYSHLINPRVTPEILEMFSNLKETAKKLNVTIDPLPLSIMSVEEIKNLLPTMVKLIPAKTDERRLDEFSNNFNLPKDFVKFVVDIKTASTPNMNLINITDSINWNYTKDSDFIIIGKKSQKKLGTTSAIGGYVVPIKASSLKPIIRK